MADGTSDPVYAPGTTLAACSPETIARLAKVWRISNHDAGSMILDAEDCRDDVYFVLCGEVRASSFTSTGREVRFRTLCAGQAFGIFAAIDGLPRSTNIIAATRARVAQLTAAEFRDWIDTDASFRNAILVNLVGRLRALSEQITRLTAYSAEQRLVAELLARGEPDANDPDRAAVAPMPTQSELATLILGHREQVSRDLRRLKEAGLVRQDGGALAILSIAGLRARLPR